MTKKFFLFLIPFFCFIQMNCEAKNQCSEDLSKIEKSIFNMSYEHQNDENRLNRIEKNIYGAVSSKPNEIRIKKLKKDIFADLIGCEIKPKKDSFLKENEIIVEKPVEDMNFSIINDLEKKVFEYEFKTLDISHRLSALENQVLKKCYLQDDLNTRIDRLKDVVFYNKPQSDTNKVTPDELRAKAEIIQIKNIPEKKEFQAEENIGFVFNLSPSSKAKLSSLERKEFNNEFSNESNSMRLARLERKVFNADFSDDENENRLNRISDYKEAQGSIKKYKKSSKYVSTAIQAGTILLILMPFLL